ncbi:LacI family DNA-binding transcriptional regulator [Isoptericola sp. NPDC057559]|uniref:LacI family DNA-binding transcriptional regulator n=1 Tax=Isoptericola sp. NPDC057559 TaxID=3346168 RepID=UPI00367D85A3
MPTIKDVARHAGVTHAVVSRILNGDTSLRVRPETRERVLAAAAELEYIPHHAAKALRESRAGAIGLAVHDLSNPVYGEVIKGAQEALSAHHSVLMLADAAELHRDAAAFRRFVASGAIDALLLLPAGDDSDAAIARDAAARIPTVLVNERSADYQSVSADEYAAGALAVEHLAGLGHRDIGLLHLDGATRRGSDRIDGHVAGLREHGLELDERWVLDGGHEPETGREALRELVARGPLPSAVVVHSVQAAVGVLLGAKGLGIQVPEELSIVGFHDMRFAAYLEPALTVVRLGLREMGAAAVETAMRLLDGQAVERHVKVTEPAPSLVVRGSTSPPRPAVTPEAR